MSVQPQYKSEYGWSMSLPMNWRLLPTSNGPALTSNRPVVVCNEDNTDLWLTWTVASHPVDEKLALDFLAIILAQQPSSKDVAAVAPTIFPVIGKIEMCEVVQLSDGNRAIEVIERYNEDGSDETKYGYQLIMSFTSTKDFTKTAPVFQRLCFYAPAVEFRKHIADVRDSARSFHYTRKYGYNPNN